MYKKISTKRNENIKNIVKLTRCAKHRNKQNMFVAEGLRLCKELVNNNIKILSVFFTLDLLEKQRKETKMILDTCDKVYQIDSNIMKYISDTKSPQGIICLCEKPLYSNELLDKILILEKIQDPGNMGTILRTAKAMCIDNIVLSKDCCDPFSPKVLRSCMGGIFSANIHLDVDIYQFVDKLNFLGYDTYASVVDKNSTKIQDIKFSRKSAVLIGNEGNGLTQKAISLCKYSFTLPMDEHSESLNAAIAAGIIIWEMSK